MLGLSFHLDYISNPISMSFWSIKTGFEQYAKKYMLYCTHTHIRLWPYMQSMALYLDVRPWLYIPTTNQNWILKARTYYWVILGYWVLNMYWDIRPWPYIPTKINFWMNSADILCIRHYMCMYDTSNFSKCVTSILCTYCAFFFFNSYIIYIIYI